jgi:hypothetical protein
MATTGRDTILGLQGSESAGDAQGHPSKQARVKQPRGLSLADLRTCDGCAGPIITPQAPEFYVLRASAALAAPGALGAVLDRAKDTAKNIRELDELVAAYPVVRLMGDEPGQRWAEAHLCRECWQQGPRLFLSPQSLLAVATKRADVARRGDHGHAEGYAATCDQCRAGVTTGVDLATGPDESVEVRR